MNIFMPNLSNRAAWLGMLKTFTVSFLSLGGEDKQLDGLLSAVASLKGAVMLFSKSGKCQPLRVFRKQRENGHPLASVGLFWNRTSFGTEVLRSCFKTERVIDDLQVLRCTVTFWLGGLS